MLSRSSTMPCSCGALTRASICSSFVAKIVLNVCARKRLISGKVDGSSEMIAIEYRAPLEGSPSQPMCAPARKRSGAAHYRLNFHPNCKYSYTGRTPQESDYRHIVRSL